MKTDYLIAFFAIAGTGLGNPLSTSDLAPRAESMADSADQSLVKEFCLNTPAVASEEHKDACNSALESLKRDVQVRPGFFGPHLCHKLPSTAPPPLKKLCGLHKSPKRNAEGESSAPLDDSDDGVEPGNEAKRDAGGERSGFSPRSPQEDADDGGADGWAETGEGQASEEVEGDPDMAGASRKRDAEAGFRNTPIIRKVCSKLPASASPSMKAFCSKYKSKGRGRRAVEEAGASGPGSWVKRSNAPLADDDGGDDDADSDVEWPEKRFAHPMLIKLFRDRCAKLGPNASDRTKEACAKFGFKTKGKRAGDGAATVDEEGAN